MTDLGGGGAPARATIEPTAPVPPAYFRMTIAGEPEAKGRPRVTTIGGHARMYQPATTRKYEDRVRQTAIRDWGRDPLQHAAIELLACFYLPVPSSWSKWKQEAALAGEIVPTGKPDLDNLVKACQDGMTGVVYADDALIVDKRIAKRYDANPRVDLILRWRRQRSKKDEA